MDEDLNKAVVEAFVCLHEKRLVYRVECMVNWAPLLKIAFGDLEVEYSDKQGKLYYFKYMVEDTDGTCYYPAVLLRVLVNCTWHKTRPSCDFVYLFSSSAPIFIILLSLRTLCRVSAHSHDSP
jgi:valyl-tRNA synthetase